ncbi:MAG: 4-hydroxy-3-methylbut-2-en-1-yl diphosphate synthase [Firmicutes bacterium HGW-Firmicutes-12]|jgi:(E)-4-hydroxy-3-methylbut-2-enyl-diphosphate synthase|nr:MAG: 4-hydroxy-3-methylbut-2-en-1-yl diphosphate synthase [Firmicutes bacterium HGW-Firmicutes-12]
MQKEQILRRRTKSIVLGGIGIGHEYPVSIQSMTNTDTRDIQATITQIRELTAAGCEIVRLAVPDKEAAESLDEIIKQSPLPVIADIHFDHLLALRALEKGVQGLRLNPGNIGSESRVREVVREAIDRKVPIRIGVNSGSLEKKLLDKYQGPCSEAMVESALGHIRILEELGFDMIKISLKSSYVPMMLAAYRRIASLVTYPLHLGVTEAGLMENGTIKSAIGIGTLLSDGIGDTIRVSLTGNPASEIKVAKLILRTLGLRKQGVEVVSCPTCGRCQIDLYSLAKAVEEKTAQLDLPLTIAVMGCIVNGPGEAREADIGIAGGKGEGLLFVKGKIVRKVPEAELLAALFEEIDKVKGV